MPRIFWQSCAILATTAPIASSCILLPREGQSQVIETAVAGTIEAQADVANTVAAQVELTVSAFATRTAPTHAPETALSSPTVAAPAQALTPTPPVVRLSISGNTNCRAGPSSEYEFQGTFLAGATTEAIARSTVDNYWYVPNPDRPGEFCWLWGAYATLVGDATVLPVFTALPSPTPGPAFTLRLSRLFMCGDIHAVLRVQNTSPYTFMSAERHVLDLDTSTDLSSRQLDPSPFAPGSTNCPPGSGNRLDPGDVGYIYVPLNPVPSGDTARATIKLCTQAGLGGLCYTQRVDFEIP